MSIQWQWDLAKSSFSTVNELRELIGIASQPNVQPQVILAAENLGFGFVVSSKRIEDAIGALGGNDSIRLESIQGHIGLRSRDLQRIVRQSTSLLQFFLVITACKPCFTDSELGDLAFSMLDKTNVLRKYPVSSTQLTQFIQTLSGHAEMIVPIMQLGEIAVAVDNENPSCSDLYDRMGAEDLANLLIHTFEGLADQDVIEMKLKGHTHAVWLATLFSWLRPDATHVCVGEKSIKGIIGTKLTIDIMVDGSDPWELEVFKADTDVTKYVFNNAQDEITSIYRIPLHQAKHFFNDHYGPAVEDSQKRRIMVQVIGELARMLTIFFCEHGRLYTPKDCCKDSFPKCMTAPMIKVMGDSALSSYANAIEAYGWDSEYQGDIRIISHELQIRLAELIPQLHEKDSPQEVLKAIHETCSVWVTRVTNSACDASYIIDPATYIALDATITSTVKVMQGTRYLSPLTAMDLDRTDEIVGKLLFRDGLDIQEFRRLAFTHLLPGLPSFHPQDLIVSYGGYTVGMDVLWTISTEQRNVLGIRYAPGHIDKDGIPISRVRESDFVSYSLSTESGPTATLFEQGMYKPLSAQSSTASFETRTSIQGDQLIVKHYIKMASLPRPFMLLGKGVASENDNKVKASWIVAIYVLATAKHIGRGHDLTVTQEREMARRLHDKGLEMSWNNRIPTGSMKTNFKMLLTTSGFEKLRFFSASSGYEKGFRSDRCFLVVVRHNAPLLSCIQAAEEKDGAWVVIA
jgi:hypothetical protein